MTTFNRNSLIVSRYSKRVTNTFHVYKDNSFVGTYDTCEKFANAIGVERHCISKITRDKVPYSGKLEPYTIYVEPFGHLDGFAIKGGRKTQITQEEKKLYLKRIT